MEEYNRFKIVIPSYNNSEWVEYNVISIINQTYPSEYIDVLYIDDASTDDTKIKVQSLIKECNCTNWTILTNDKNYRRGYNTAPKQIQHFITNDSDVLIFVDGDDWLYDSDVLSKLNDFYNKHDCWMTYGGLVCWPGGHLPSPQNSPYPDIVHEHNAYRRDGWRASHLRTFRWGLYRQIKDEDLKIKGTDKYYFHAEDLAASFPCLEMCPPEKIGVVDFTTYVFNEAPQNRARGIKREQEAGPYLENEIRSNSIYQELKTIYA